MRREKRKGESSGQRSGHKRTVRSVAVLLTLLMCMSSSGFTMPAAAVKAASAGTYASDISTASQNDGTTADNAKASAGKEEAFSDSVQIAEGERTLTVTASAEAGVLPSGAKLTVTPVTADDDATKTAYSDMEKKLKEDAKENSRSLDGFLPYDIAFTAADGTETEPSGSVDIRMSWDSAAAPEGAAADSSVELLRLDPDKDGSMTVTDLTKDKDSNADIKTADGSDSADLDSAAFTAEQSGSYVLAWEEEQKAAADKDKDNGKKSADAAADTAQSDSGQTADTDSDAAVTGDSTAAASGSAAASGDPAADEEPADSKTADAASQSGAPAASAETQTISAENDDFSVSVYYGKDAKLPEGAKLSVSDCGEDSDEYSTARNALLRDLSGKDGVTADTLGLRALDISILDKDGNEIEPQAAVTVRIQMKNLPDGVQDGTALRISHITNTGAQETPAEAKANPVLRLARRAVKQVQTLISGIHAETVADNILPQNGTASAEFTVDAFSVFTITWTTSTPNATRIGNVRIHYVDASGLEHDLKDTETVDPADLSKTDNGIVDLKTTWGSKSIKARSDEDANAEFVYDHAVIGTLNGQTITGIKVQSSQSGSTTYYKLYYTTDGTVNDSSKWTEYTDSVSKKDTGNAEIYLIYNGYSVPVTIHFITFDGSAITDDAGNPITKTIDGATANNLDLMSWADNAANIPAGYQVVKVGGGINNSSNSQSTRITLNTTSFSTTENGNYLRYLKYQKDSSSGNYYVYAGRGNANNPNYEHPGKMDGNRDIYISLGSIGSDTKVTFHHVDQYGAQLADNTTQTITAAQRNNNSTGYNGRWNGWGNFSSFNFDAAGIVRKSGIGTWQYASYDSFKESGTKGNATATNQYGIYYKWDGSKWHSATSGADSAEIDSANPHFVSDIYQIYSGKKGLTVHYVDESGKELQTKGMAFGNGSTFKAAEQSLTGYTYKGAYLDSAKTNPFTTINFAQSGENWTTNVKNGDTDVTTSSITNEAWLVFSKTVDTTKLNIHYVDENGNSIKDTTTLKIPQSVGDTAEKDATNTNKGYTGYLLDSETYKIDNYFLQNVRINSMEGATAPAGTRIIYQVENKTSNTDISSHYTTRDFSANYFKDISNATALEKRDYNGKQGYIYSIADSENLITDVYLVYKTSHSAQFTVHYVYKDGTTTSQTAIPNADPATDKFTLSNDGTIMRLNTTATQEENQKKNDFTLTGKGGLVATGVTRSGSDTSQVSYMATHIGAYDGFTATSVMVDDDGTVLYHSGTGNDNSGFNTGTVYTMPYDHETGNWSASDKSGRSLVISEANGNYTLEDTQHGSIELNLSESGTTNTYTATFHGEEDTTVYSAVKTNSQEFKLTVTNYIPSKSRDIYLLYDDAAQKIAIDNDIKYTGLLKVKLPDDVQRELYPSQANGGLTYDSNGGITYVYGTTSDPVYEWHRVETPRNSDGTLDTNNKKDITLDNSQRHQSGEHWNYAYEAKDRTWLDVEADEGRSTWTYGTQVSYYLKLNYTLTKNEGESSTETKKSYQSEPTVIDYYGQLENGSFERPVVSGTNSNMQYPNTDNQTGAATGYTKSYASLGGIWHTTGLGKDTTKTNPSNYIGHDIEIVNTATNQTYRKDYSWQGTDGAQDGDQFAELNCETAGALYQDVITHPNETMSYGLSHRARGNKSQNTTKNQSNAQYDSMYLVIMPTKIAMTSSSTGTELQTQDELVQFIKDHGGYTNGDPGGEEDKITYQDYDNGILIRKIASSNLDWHTINTTNGYTAKGGLTRFFFVAAHASSGNNTVGNFLDNVWFSQSLPTPKGFNLTVTKTFTGLTQEQIANLASTKTVGSTKTTNENPFTFTITDEYTQSGETLHNNALQNAKLQFTATSSGANTYSFTATAKQWLHNTGTLTENWESVTEEEYNSHKSDSDFKTKYKVEDLFAGDDNESKGTVTIRGGNTVVINWTLREQGLVGTASDGVFRYTVAETNGSVGGLTQNATYTLNGGATQTGTSGTINVRAGSTADYAFSNSYRENTGDDSQITVQKVFSGVTQSTVNRLLNSETPYSITIKKINDGGGTAIEEANQPTLTLTPSTTGTVADANTNVEKQYAVSYSAVEDPKSGKMTLTWTIRRPDEGETDADALMGGPGIYSISETNFTPTPQQDNGDNNSLSSVEVNGKEVKSDLSGSTISEGKIYVGKVGETDYSPTVEESSDTNVTKGPVAAASATLDTSTNLIIAKTSNTGYLVWTKETAGANTREAILKKINSVFNSKEGSTKAVLHDVSFFSQENPGELKYSNTQHPGMTMTYDSTTGKLSFANETGSEPEGSDKWTWSQYYSTHFTLRDGTGYNAATDNADNKMTNNATEVRVANSYEPIVRIKKVDKDSREALNGATFRFFKYQNGKKVYLLTNKNGDNFDWAEEKDVTSDNPVRTFTTSGVGDAQGIVSMGRMETANALNQSKSGSIIYYLEETDAPAGYNKLTKPLAFVVHADGTVERWSKDGSYEGTTDDNVEVDNTVAEIDWNSPYYTVTISNSTGIALPVTGGRGTQIFTILGLLLIASGGVLLGIKNRKRGGALR